MKEYKWNEDTIDNFKFISSYAEIEEVHGMIKEFVEIDCQLEDEEEWKDLVDNLMKTIYGFSL
jgi:adenylate cyclase class IV